MLRSILSNFYANFVINSWTVQETGLKKAFEKKNEDLEMYRVNANELHIF